MDTYLTRQSLLLRAKNHEDSQAWEELLSIYNKYIYVIIRSKGISQNHSEDIFQSIAVSLWQSLKNYQPEKAKFRHWLARIVHNKTVDFIRKEQSHRDKLDLVNKLDYFASVSENELEKMAEENWKVFISNLAISNIKDKLSENALKCLELYLNGHEQKEIADKLDLKQDTVYKNISRSKIKLFQEVQKLKKQLDL